MSYLSRLQADDPEKQAGGEPSKPTKAPFDPFAGKARGLFGGLDPVLAQGLMRLQNMRAPRIARPEVWAEVVADSVRLATDGWASIALSFEDPWHPLHLWGVSPAAGGIADLEGLAVWIAGRPIRVLTATCCTVGNGPGSYSFFNRRSVDGAVLLWELGDRGNER